MANVRISDLTAGTPPYDSLTEFEVSVPNAGAPSGFDSRKALLGDVTPGGRPEIDYALAAQAIDLDFVNNLFWNAPNNPASPFVVTRASVGYIDTVAGVWSSVSAGSLRRSNKGVLIEESRTNSIRNNSMQGAGPGTPGTLPTNWVQNINGGVTRTINGTGVENGIDYIEIRVAGTLTGTGVVVAITDFFEASNQIAASNAQVWAFSGFVSIVAGSTTNITTIGFGRNENNASGVFIGGNQGTSFLSSLSGTLTRFASVLTNIVGATAFVQPYININGSAGTAIDITFRLGWPQTELVADTNSTYSSPIRTTSAAATRAADVVSLNLPPSFATSYTLAGAGTPNQPLAYGNNQYIVSINDSGIANRFAIFRTAATGLPRWIINSTGTAIGAVAWAQNTAGILAAANAVSSQAGSFNGAADTNGSSAVSPTGFTIVQIGANGNDINQWNGYITRILIWPDTRLGDQAVVDIATLLPTANGFVTEMVGASSVSSVGLIPPSSTPGGWAITSNYDNNEVSFWSTVNSTATSGEGFEFHQKIDETTEVLLAALYGDATLSEWDFYVPAGPANGVGSTLTEGFIGTGNAFPLKMYSNNLNTLTLDPGGFVSIIDGLANGQSANIKALTELTTIAAAATTSTVIQLPARSMVLGVSVRVTTVIPTAATFTVGVTGAAARYGTGISTAANTTFASPPTDNAFYNASAVSILITPNLTPGNNTGRVRVTVHYVDFTPPTS